MGRERKDKQATVESSDAGHRKRLKERFTKGGLDSFSEHEIIEIMLFYAIPRRDTKKIAKRMLGSFGSLHELFEADPAEIVRRCEVSDHTAIFFSLISQLARSYMISKCKPKEYVDSPEKAAEYAKALLTSANKESFFLICLNKQKRLIRADRISIGTVDAIEVNLRQIVEKAVMYQSSYVIITHNHPGGALAPSYEDVQTTKLIIEALAYVNITVSDHIIIAGLDYYSFAKKSILGLKY